MTQRPGANPYEAPRSELDRAEQKMSDEEAMVAARPPAVLTLAGFATAGSGFTFIAFGYQLFTMFHVLHPVMRFAPHGLFYLGLASLVLGGFVTKARPRLHDVAMGLQVALCLIAIVWVVWALLAGVLTAVSLFGIGMSAVACFLLALSRRSARRCAVARRVLQTF